jgi:CheY-like chemotaxis protein
MAKILVVDDEFGIAELFEALLSDEGHSVLTASNGKNALQLLTTERPDLIFLDYMMPVMDGAAMLKIVGAEERLRQIPVVMMSSMPEATIAERVGGYVLFMRKPFLVSEILAVVQRLAVKPVPKTR